MSLSRVRPSALAVLFALAPACGEPAKDPSSAVQVGEVDQAFRTGWHGDGHAEITAAGLSFLKGAVVTQLIEQNEGVDGNAACNTAVTEWFVPDCVRTKLRSEYHFDNCRIGESFASLRFRYGAAIAALDPAAVNFDEALHRFGQILHTTQDFYSHSNWVDARPNALVSQDEFLPPQLSPGSPLGGMVVVAQSMPAGWSVTRDYGSRIPSVWDGVSWRDGLISGTYVDNVDVSICHPQGSIPHGDFNAEGALDQIVLHDSYLAKDDPDSWHHEVAVSMAEEQTAEEFCRLARLVSLRYGDPGRQALIDEWVGNVSSYEAACPNDRSLVAALIMTAV